MSLQRFVILFAAAFFVLYGLAFSLSPVAMSVFVTGSSPQGVSALVDFRATYGGMTTAVGITLIYLYRIGLTRPALVVIIVVLLAMAFTRTLGLLVDGAGNFFMYLYLVLELAGSALAYAALRIERHEQ